jgi:hypothetical protein
MHASLRSCLAALLLLSPALARAAAPASGTLSPSGGSVTWTGTESGGSSTTGEAGCQEGVSCDSYLLTLGGAPADWAGHVVNIKITYLTAINFALIFKGYDLYVHQGTLAGPLVASAKNNFDSEAVSIDPAVVGTGLFTVHAVATNAISSNTNVTAVGQYNGSATVSVGPAQLATGVPPRFQVSTPSEAQQTAGIATSAGEPSIGVNWISGKVFFQSFVQTLRVSYADQVCPGTPSSVWEQVQSPFTGNFSQDPILYTDSQVGRTFVSQLVFGSTESLSAFTDDDGAHWTPTQGAGIASGIDHQTLGGGPAFAQPVPQNPVYPHPVYYCAQDLADANCAISYDGGITFGPAVVVYSATQCGGLHGHIKVGPDGTAYLPNKSCKNPVTSTRGQGVVVSKDNGATWTVRTVPGSAPAGSDPSVGIGRFGRVYLGYADGNHQPVIAISDDSGQTWHGVANVGASFGIQNSVFSEVVAGDDDRAAFFYLGTATAGDLQGQQFAGIWHAYVATTYDAGQTWFEQDVTPNDPVQRGPIWLQGGAVLWRNLLDFNDETVDAKGRIHMALADGCTHACVQASGAGNAYEEVSTIIRQVGGRTLFSINDPPAGASVPGAPALTVIRNGAVARLSWSSTNDGGSPITNFKVQRGTASGAETFLANAGTANSYVDPTTDANTTYYYRVVATNAAGDSCGSDEFPSAPTGSSCAGGGITVGTGHPGTQKGAPANAGLNILRLGIGEPFFNDGGSRLVFTMKVADLSTVPPDSQWFFVWGHPSSPTSQWYVGMVTDAQGHVTYQYGTYQVTSAVVVGIPQVNPIGAPDSGSFTPDGTITIAISNSLVGGVKAGDLLGALLGRTFTLTGSATARSTTAIDTVFGSSYLLAGNLYCSPPTVSVIEDNDPRIAYSTGWHHIADTAASGGSFAYSRSANSNALLSFGVPAGQFGAITYNFGTSKNGGTAEIFLDGVSQGTVSYKGSAGTTTAPVFASSARYANLTPGSHTLFIVGRGGPIDIDDFVLQSSFSNSNPPSHPGATSTGSATALPGQNLVTTVSLPSGTTAVSVVAETGVPAQLQMALLDPLGKTVAISSGDGNGNVTLEAFVSSGNYVLQLLNLGLGPVSVFTAVTPTGP